MHILETSVPGVLAAGDVRSGSTKPCATAVGEGAMAVQLVHAHLAERANARGELPPSGSGDLPLRFLRPLAGLHESPS